MVIKVILIIPVILTVVAYFRTLSVRSKRSRRKEYAVYLPNSWRTLLISLAVTSEIFSFIAILDNDNKEVEICFFIFAFLFLFLIRGWKNWYIIYDDKGFLETTFGGKKRYFTYNQVTAYRKWYTRNGGEYCVFVENKRVYVDFEAVNCGEFMSYVKEKYKMLHNDEELPENNGRWFGNCLNIREHERKTYMNNRNLMYDLKPFWIYWGVLVLACILFFICPLLGILILPMLLIIIPVWIIIVYLIGNAVQKKSGLKQIRKRIVLSFLCAFLTTMIFPVGVWIYDAVKWNEVHLESLVKNFEDAFLWIMFIIHFLAFWLGEEIKYLSGREHKK